MRSLIIEMILGSHWWQTRVDNGLIESEEVSLEKLSNEDLLEVYDKAFWSR
jgi:hypothetical protein